MEEKANDKLNRFTRKLMKDFSVETPSFGFTEAVMSKVGNLHNSQVFEYKPLISKRSWIILALSVVGGFSYLVFNSENGIRSGYSMNPMNYLIDVFTFPLPDYELSDILFFAVIGFTFFIVVQILLLKKHFDERLSIG